MRLNKQGMSLMELLVSIILIGIVLVFLLQLLLGLRNETDNNNFAYNNQLNRAEAIYTIENDLNTYTLTGISNNSDDLSLTFDYMSANGTVQAKLFTSTKKELINGIETTTYYLNYHSYNNEDYSWEMKGAALDECAILTYDVDNVANEYYFKLNIYVYNNPYHERNNELRNNAVDDIEISYSSSTENLIMSSNNLLNNNGNKKIGKCTN